MRNKIRSWLIRLANWIGDGSYYDFGEPVIALVTFRKNLIIGTSNSLYKYDGKKYTKIAKIKETKV